MELLSAFAHFGGAFLALVVLEIVVLIFEDNVRHRYELRFFDDLSVEIGIPAEKLRSESVLDPEIFGRLSERFSSELFRNRISDFCGLARTIWNFTGVLIVWGAMVVVLGLIIFESGEIALLAWSAPAMRIFFFLMSALFSFACLLLFGRFPGQAKQMRQALAKHLAHSN